ncbi:MAG: chorismate lyase [Moraxellaceae bacterium]|nr:chorismate lyase [Moraxellaceae bacterium]
MSSAFVERWQRRPPFPPQHALHPWLTDAGSLTARIAARCGRVSVRVLAQRLAVPRHDEALLAGIRPGRRAWLREILLCADGVPVVYARSVLPREALRSGWAMFAGIGNRPLGAALFSDPLIARGPLAVRRLDARDARYHRAVASAGSAQPRQLWARRSRFERQGRALVVCEIFLAAILDLPAQP